MWRRRQIVELGDAGNGLQGLRPQTVASKDNTSFVAIAIEGDRRCTSHGDFTRG